MFVVFLVLAVLLPHFFLFSPEFGSDKHLLSADALIHTCTQLYIYENYHALTYVLDLHSYLSKVRLFSVIGHRWHFLRFSLLYLRHLLVILFMFSVYSPNDVSDVTKDDDNVNALHYSVLNDSDSVRCKDIRKLIQEAEARSKRTAILYEHQKSINTDDIIHQPVCHKIRPEMKHSLAAEEEGNHSNENKAKSKFIQEEHMLYAVCVARGEEERHCMVETQENMKDVKRLIHDMEERLKRGSVLEQPSWTHVSRPQNTRQKNNWSGSCSTVDDDAAASAIDVSVSCHLLKNPSYHNDICGMVSGSKVVTCL